MSIHAVVVVVGRVLVLHDFWPPVLGFDIFFHARREHEGMAGI